MFSCGYVFLLFMVGELYIVVISEQIEKQFVNHELKKTKRSTNSCNVPNGDILYGSDNYIEFRKGDAGARIIITASHGGATKPSDLRTRTHGCYQNGVCNYDADCTPKDGENCKVLTLSDSYTKQLAEKLVEELKLISDVRPHFVLSNLHRSRLDPNREIGEAAQGDPTAEQAYQDYHGFIDMASCLVNSSGGGLLLDIHGMTHTNVMLELSYLITKWRLNNDKLVPNYTSVKNLAKNVNVTFEELIRGSQSLGSKFQNEDYDTLPSVQHPKPNQERYFSGGHTLRQHGSRYSGRIDAIQMEHAKALRNSDAAPAYAKAAARAINSFFQRFYVS